MLTINHAPEAWFSANPVCLNKTTTFKDLSINYGVDIASWKWNFGDPSSGIENFSASPNPSHKYYIQEPMTLILLVINKSGCKDSLTKPTKYLDFPGAKFDNNPGLQ